MGRPRALTPEDALDWRGVREGVSWRRGAYRCEEKGRNPAPHTAGPEARRAAVEVTANQGRARC